MSFMIYLKLHPHGFGLKILLDEMVDSEVLGGERYDVYVGANLFMSSRRAASILK